MAKPSVKHEAPVTGRMPAMLQDCNRQLSKWLAQRIDSRRHAREAASSIEMDRQDELSRICMGD